MLQDEVDEASSLRKQVEHWQIMMRASMVRFPISETDYLDPTLVGTENAIMMMPTGSSLFAKQCNAYTRSSVQGPDFWLSAPPEMNRMWRYTPVSADDAIAWRTESPDSIGQFVMDHVLASATTALNGDEVISKALNIWMRKDVHQAVESVRRILSRISQSLEHFSTTGEWPDAVIARWWRESLISQRQRLNHFDIESSFMGGKNMDELVSMCLDVSRVTEPYILNEATDSDWDECMNNAIIIGGAKAGRAVVFKGLTGMYIPLDPVVNAEDTNLQGSANADTMSNPRLTLHVASDVASISKRFA